MRDARRLRWVLGGVFIVACGAPGAPDASTSDASAPIDGGVADARGSAAEPISTSGDGRDTASPPSASVRAFGHHRRVGQTLYSHALRILTCAQCGAPVDASARGGSVTCAYCHAVSHFPCRDESADLSAPRAARSGDRARTGLSAG